jgi:hypothetical protein
MIGKLLRLAVLVVVSLSIGTVLAQALGLGYCWSQGWLERSKLERWLAVAEGKARIVMPEEEKKEETSDRLQAVALVDVARARAIKSRDFELREQSLQNQVDEFQLERTKLAEERSRYTQIKTVFEKELSELRAGLLSNDAEITRQIIENMKAKQAKEQIVIMMDAGSMTEVVDLISAMAPAKRAKLLAEFKTPEENERLAKILTLIRKGEPELTLIDDAKTQLQPVPKQEP